MLMSLQFTVWMLEWRELSKLWTIYSNPCGMFCDLLVLKLLQGRADVRQLQYRLSCL